MRKMEQKRKRKRNDFGVKTNEQNSFSKDKNYYFYLLFAPFAFNTFKALPTF
jgi:hypothetical protein